MSDSPKNDPTEQITTEPTTAEAAPRDEPSAAPETTVGTGTAMALGCVVGTIILILFGLIFIFAATMM